MLVGEAWEGKMHLSSLPGLLCRQPEFVLGGKKVRESIYIALHLWRKVNRKENADTAMSFLLPVTSPASLE